MRQFHVVLVDHGIMHGGVDFDVTEELLDLLDGHAFVDGHGGQCPAELVGMYPWHLGFFANLAQANFDTRDLQPTMRLSQRDEQGLVFVTAAVEVLLQMYLGAGIEIDDAFLVAFAEDDAFALVEVDI